MFLRRYRPLSLAVPGLALLMAGCGSTPNSRSANPGATANTVASGPILGSWWDASAAGLRTVYGVAGAAYQGPTVYNDGEYSGAGVCMRASVALLTTKSGALYLTNVRQGTPVQVTSQGIANAQIVFSPSCASALAYQPGTAGALVLRGLLSAGRTTASVSLPAGTTSAAVSDTGSILVSVPGANGSATIQFLASGSDAFQSVTQLANFGGMAFLPGADTALLADAAKNTIVEAAQLTTDPALTQIAGASAGVAHPVAIAASSDGHAAAVANQDGSLLRLDLSGDIAPVRTTCACSPTELQPLAGNLAFRLNEPGTGTVWAYDGDAVHPRVVFIPTDQVATHPVAAVKGGAR